MLKILGKIGISRKGAKIYKKSEARGLRFALE